MRYQNEQNPLYGVEIKLDNEGGTRNKGATKHVECHDLSNVIAFIDAHDGELRIFDRQKRELVFDGHAAALRELLWYSADCADGAIEKDINYYPSVAY